MYAFNITSSHVIYFREGIPVVCYASCHMFAHSFHLLFIHFYYLSCTFVAFVTSLFLFLLFFFFLYFHLVLLSENIHGSKRRREEELLYAVKYFSGISHVDPFTAGSISLELWHFRRKISSPSFPGIFSHLIRFYVVVFLKSLRLASLLCGEKNHEQSTISFFIQL